MRHLFLASAAALIATAAPALADTFSFSYSAPSITTSGTLQATDQGNGQFLITSIQGSQNGMDIASLDGANVFGSNDDLFFPSGSTVVDFSGFSFTTTDGTQYNIYSSDGYIRESTTGYDDGANGSLSVTPTTPTPEPSALVLLGSGTLAAFGAMRRNLAS